MANKEPSQRAPYVESFLSIARGGPIFVPDLVSPLTRVSNFESEVFHELESLKAELDSGHIDYEEDVSVDDLKLYTDEELVSEAMKIAFENDQEASTCTNLAEDPCTSRAVDGDRMIEQNTSASCESFNGLSSEASHDGEKNDVKSLKKKNKRAENKDKTKNKKGTLIVHKQVKRIDESYLAKVEHLAKIRQKQEDDKATVKLHSFKFSPQKESSTTVSSGKMETLRFLELSSWPVKSKSSVTETHVPIQFPEVILSVEVYDYKQSWKKTQEFLVLGCQTLTELRDKIHCLADVVMQKAVERHPDEFTSDPSGYFLIEEIFCNDIRDPSAIDYSEPILDWLKNSKEEALAKWDSIISGVGKARKVLLGDKPVSNLPNFRSVDMQRTRFRDLGFRVGSGYLYCHQGDCRHIIVFRDMRLIHPDDVQNRAAYPLLVYQQKAILKKCSVCHIYKATRVTLDDKLAGENPCYFCDNCYYLLHYSEDNRLLDVDFKVYDYVQDYY